MKNATAHFRISRRSPQRLKQGFTLVELMVSITVLAMLGGLVMQLMGSASKLTSTSKLSSDCDTEARYALNQIAADLAHRVRRPDVDAFVDKATGDDRIYFFSETPGYSPTLSATERSDVSLVGYRIKGSKNTFGKTVYKLERYARALPWNADKETPMPFVILDSSGKPLPASTLVGKGGGSNGSFEKVTTQAASEDLYYQPIAENVVRFEISLLHKPIQPIANSQTFTPSWILPDAKLKNAADSASPNDNELSRNGFANISAVVVTLAVLDSQNALKVTEDDITQTKSKLDDTAPNDFPKYPLDSWNSTFLSNANSWKKPITNGLRFYQRVIGL